MDADDQRQAEGTGDPGRRSGDASYRRYLETNTAGLTAATRPFVAAVIAGGIPRAKALYPATRVPYGRVEPVAGSLGDLDPRIDARQNEVAATEFRVPHRLEKALWEEGTTKGMTPIAKALLADVEELQRRVRSVKLQAAQIVNGANELLSEVSATKITGEEERYSHIAWSTSRPTSKAPKWRSKTCGR
jgi:iron uptake system component EfeO